MKRHTAKCRSVTSTKNSGGIVTKARPIGLYGQSCSVVARLIQCLPYAINRGNARRYGRSGRGLAESDDGQLCGLQHIQLNARY